MVNCPNCDAVVDVDEDELDEGDTLTCEECGADLAISSVDPIEVELLDDDEEEEEEDENEDLDYDEDEEEEEEEEDEEDWK